MNKNCLPIGALVIILLVFGAAVLPAQEDRPCRPTRPDALGPFYKPGAPRRESVGQGYLLSGRVLSAGDCRPLPGAVLELWLAGPDGQYADAYRATVTADGEGRFRFQCHLPVPYAGRPAHIHIRVSSPGFETLVTQHYPMRGQREGRFELVLAPLRG